MEKKSNTNKITKTILKNVDRNDDGKLDLEDVSIIAESVGNKINQGTKAIKTSVQNAKYDLDLKTLRPIFVNTLDDTEFLMPKFIRITERDKKYRDSEACKGAIGYKSTQNGLSIVNIFNDSIDVFGLTFYPDSNYEFYYADPTDKELYIAINEYFSYLKIARINELQKIAQDLGAKHFKVTYKEEQDQFTEKILKAQANVMSLASAGKEHTLRQNKYQTLEIAAEDTFSGHDPICPHLRYMRNDPSIQNLVAMRMDEKAPLTSQKFMLKLSHSSGLKEQDATKIDTAIKIIKLGAKTTISSEAKNEAKRYFEYEVTF